jgi:hypothetical protein
MAGAKAIKLYPSHARIAGLYGFVPSRAAELFSKAGVFHRGAVLMEVAMRNIATKTGRAIAASTLLCALAGAAAHADPPVHQSQRPGETPGVATPTAQPRTCMTHDGAGDKLRAEYGEKILGHGVSSDGTLVEIYLAPSGTFTVIKTTPAGLSCVVDFGEGWQTLHQLEQVGFTPETLKSVPGLAAH